MTNDEIPKYLRNDDLRMTNSEPAPRTLRPSHSHRRQGIRHSGFGFLSSLGISSFVIFPDVVVFMKPCGHSMLGSGYAEPGSQQTHRLSGSGGLIAYRMRHPCQLWVRPNRSGCDWRIRSARAGAGSGGADYYVVYYSIPRSSHPAAQSRGNGGRLLVLLFILSHVPTGSFALTLFAARLSLSSCRVE